MSSYEGLLYGFTVALTQTNLLAAFMGALTGTLVGVLPGLGPTATIAMLLPISMLMDPTPGLIMMAGIYYGAMYGGSTTSILINVPGEAASVVTCIEGHLMAKRGRAGAALAVSAVGSFVAGTLGVALISFAAPPLAGVALMFGPPEFMTLGVMGIIAVLPLLGGSILSNGFMAVLGLSLATMGMDQMTGAPRFAFGYVELTRGIDLVALCMGLFGVTEMLIMAEEDAISASQVITTKFRQLFPSIAEWRRAAPAILRGAAVGLPIGLIPGSATVLSAFLAFSLEKRIAGPKSEFGNGAIEGVAAPESANNAAAATLFISMLSLGIPFSPPTALMLAALMIHNVQPGPMMMTKHPEMFWGVIASMYLGNAMLVLLNYPLVGIWTSLLRLPRHMLTACIAIFMMIGIFSIDSSVFDLKVALVMGIAGYVFRKLHYDPLPLVLGFVLSPMIESSFRQSMIMFQGHIGLVFYRPLVVLLIFMGFLPTVVPLIYRMARRTFKLQILPENGEGQ